MSRLTMAASAQQTYHKLSDEWVLYIHLPDNSDWSFKSYINMARVGSVENAVLLNDEINYDLIKKSMIFVMKQGIKPMWEDFRNKHGGCFSFKVFNKDTEKVWKKLFFHMVGNTLTKNRNLSSLINGITVSPKKRFCIIKIWMSSCAYQEPNIFTPIEELDFQGCIFKRHVSTEN